MTGADPLLSSLRAAVTAAPGDVALRLHLADLLLDAGEHEEAVTHVAAVLGQEPGNTAAAALMTRALAAPPPAPPTTPPEPPPSSGLDREAAAHQVHEEEAKALRAQSSRELRQRRAGAWTGMLLDDIEQLLSAQPIA